MNTKAVNGDDRLVTYWLGGILIMVITMVVLGGVTRLTGSGLSMVDWRPITGWLPPLTLEEWEKVFRLYQASPQYLEINTHMDLDDFKDIFWLEYFHRLWGRLIGVAYALPLIFFLSRKYLPLSLKLQLTGLFILGGLQGGLGWYMVKSGLVSDPEVSQYRLLAHLSVAFSIIAAIIYIIFNMKRSAREDLPAFNKLQVLSGACVFFAFLTICAGAIVAGTRAGLTYNTFPLMDGMLVPDGLYQLSPWWLNSFENVTLIQFQHRLLAMLTFILIGLFYFLARNQNNSLKKLAHFQIAAVSLQVTLGILTLIYVVPVGLAALHQFGGVIVFISSLITFFATRRGGES